MMVKSLLLAILLFASAVFAATNDCGPPQCYSPCTDAKPVVDFVFMLDVSGSMGGPIAGVKSGLTSFINNLGSTITPRYALLIFGASSGNGAATRSLDFTTSASTLINKFSVTIDGGIEPGLETFLRALNSATANNFNLNYNTGLNTQKVFIMVTNEDSDPAQSSNSNLFYSGGFSQSKSQTDGYCKTSVTNYCGSGSITTLSAGVWNTYQMEITAVANALISQGASTYIFVPGTQSIAQSNSNSECHNKDVIPAQSCNTKYQYCNPDAQSQNADYTNFSPSNTYNTMVSNGQEQSLQGLLIHAGKTARCFDVYATGNSALVQNFFSQIVSDVSACHTTCYDYICITATTCQAPVNMCGCDNVKYSNKTLDPDGNCCLTKDCNGYCNNKYSYDSCGICTIGGATSSLCKTDCNGNKYISAAPTTAYTVQTINVAGYLLMNPTVKTAYINTYKSTAGVQQQFHDAGVFQGLSYCTLDLAAYNSANGVSLSQANAEAAWLASLLTSSPKTAQCAAGSHRHFPALPTDSCGQCIVNADSPPYCVKDCSGVWRTNQTLASLVDNCGACVAAGSNLDAAKDDCGVCNGGNASKNQCGVCGGSKSLDPCGNPVCQNQTCNKDCDGVNRTVSTMTLDECGNCVSRSLNPPRSNKCVQDCAGTWYNNTASTSSPHIYDECGNCIPRTLNPPRLSTCVQDCAGTWAGSAYYDQCNQCVTAPSANCKQDCNQTYYLGSNPPSLVDDCGICNPRNAQNTLKDHCGICINQVGYNTTTDCTQDCKGVYSLTTSTGRAFNDSCRDCWFANQTALANSKMDACGVCWPQGNVNNPNWNSGSGVFDSKGHPCPCGQTPTNCSDGSNTCSDSCPVYCPNTTNTLPDSCGFCPDSPRFGKVDNCGLCCDNVTTLCDIHKDSCGVCFGFDRDRQNPCNICDPTGTLCVPDCSGNYTGHLVVGCDGVCGSHAVCAVCGDGTIQPGEGCDLGTTHGVNNNKPGSGCSADCQVESGGNIGAAIGGAIGGVAAIAALALAAFFAVRYAKKAGLIGNANKQVDFGASNSNPLYKSETSVHQNPLYEN